jgi:hypothetical protein
MMLSESKYDNAETGCCARLDVDFWDGKRLAWDDELFVKDRIRAFLHIPLNFGSVVSRVAEAVEKAEAYPEHPLWLSDEVSPWRSDLYTAVDREVPGVDTEKLSGTFVTRVFEGPYKNAGKWMREMEAHVRGQGMEPLKTYFFYATCPRCAKTFGVNRVVLFTKVSERATPAAV